MMFGEEILNAKQLAMKLGVSRSYVYKMLKNGLPYHQLGSKSRKYFVYVEVQEWLLNKTFIRVIYSFMVMFILPFGG